MKKSVKTKLILTLAVLGVCFFIGRSCLKAPAKLGIKWEAAAGGRQEERCLSFIETALSSKNGIFTNFLDDGEIRAWATGHQVLSESEGLMMLYAVQSGDKRLFDRHLKIVKSMLLDDGVIAWRVGKEGELITKASAFIDDIRIIRALFFAYDRWGDNEYITTLEELIHKTKKHELTTAGPIDYYDAETKMAATTINLSYIDLYTMNLMARTDDDWNKAVNQGVELIKGGFISKNAPFYRKYYDYASKSYSTEAEINIIDYLKVLLHLSEVNLVPKEAIEWLRYQMDNYGALYNSYDVDSGKPCTNFECSASYALGCRIAANTGDVKLYEIMKDKLLTFQIAKQESVLAGAFGDVKTKEVFSFDNLQALLALQGSKVYTIRD